VLIVEAKRSDAYQITAPAEAWDLLPYQTFVVTLAGQEVTEDGRLTCQLNTIAADCIDVHITRDSTAEALMKAVASHRQLGPRCRVCVLTAEGVILEPDALLVC